MAEQLDFDNWVGEAKKNIQEISPQETAAALKRKDTLLIDAVTPMNGGKVTFLARKISVAEQSSWRSKKPRPIFQRRSLLTVAAVRRSALAAESLQRMGYKNVQSMPGASKSLEGRRLTSNKNNQSIGGASNRPLNTMENLGYPRRPW